MTRITFYIYNDEFPIWNLPWEKSIEHGDSSYWTMQPYGRLIIVSKEHAKPILNLWKDIDRFPVIVVHTKFIDMLANKIILHRFKVLSGEQFYDLWRQIEKI